MLEQERAMLENPTALRRKNERRLKQFSRTLDNPLGHFETSLTPLELMQSLPQVHVDFFMPRLPGSDMQRDAVGTLANLLSHGYLPLIEMVIEERFVPHLVELLTSDDEEFQMLGAWALSNVAAGLSEHTHILIENDAVPLLVSLLESGNNQAKLQAAWALGNVAVNSPIARKTVLQHGAFEPVLSMMKIDNTINRAVADWTLSRLHGETFPPAVYGKILPALPVLRELLTVDDDIVLIRALRVLKSLTSKLPSELGTAIAEANIHQNIRALLNSGTSSREVPWLALSCIGRLAVHDEAIIDESLSTLIAQLMKKTGFDFQIQATRVIFNGDLKSLPCKECIEALCDLLSSENYQLLKVSLDGLRNFLDEGEVGNNIYSQMIKDCEGDDKIRKLMNNNNVDIAAGATIVGSILGMVD